MNTQTSERDKPSAEQILSVIARLQLQLDLSTQDAQVIAGVLMSRIDETPVRWAFKALLPTSGCRQCDHCGKY